MIPFSLKAITLSTLVATGLAAHGYRRKSLSPSGALTAWIVGFSILSCGLRGFLLILFYQLGSSATKYRKDEKRKLDSTAAESSCRGPEQVLACSFLATIFSLFHAYWIGEEKYIDFSDDALSAALSCAVIAHHSTCCADTLASEFGILNRNDPRLITRPWMKVPPGTNGGVTFNGFCWSIIGGVLIGIDAFFCDGLTLGFDFGESGIALTYFTSLSLFGGLSGLLGSVLDSYLGATLQASYYDNEKKLSYCGSKEGTSLPRDLKLVSGNDILSNAQVNFVSIILTCYVSAKYLGPLFF
mmetsp:Transcript_17327/g.22546  ORF Transcript_17327/g.22546 Transcript_17327/m.22546 type:complete len:299 (-) Transcript_17327:958-1854(-)